MGAIEALNPARYEAKAHPTLTLQSPDMLVYAGNSRRRNAFFQQAVPVERLHSVSIGPEPDTDIAEVARHKVNVVSKHGIPRDLCFAIVAVDTHTVNPIIDKESGEIKMKSRGKPKNIVDVQDAFQQISQVSQMRNEEPFYYTDAATAMFHANGAFHLVEDREQCLVTLDRSGAEWLGREGLGEYLEQFNKFYSQPPYSTHAMEVGIFDLSGGISLPVLVKMGLVKSVDGVDRGDTRFRETLLFGIHKAAIGVSPDVLRAVQINGREAIKNWPWLNGVVDSALSS